MIQPSECVTARAPARSTLMTSPPSSPCVGWWRKATRSPSGETRTWLSQPAVSKSVVPTGYSTRHFPEALRMTARLAPSGPQSAHCTSSRISRGAPPSSAAWATIPVQTKRPAQWRSRERAIWPVVETDRISASGSARALDSGLSGRVENSRQGCPSQLAP